MSSPIFLIFCFNFPSQEIRLRKMKTFALLALALLLLDIVHSASLQGKYKKKEI